MLIWSTINAIPKTLDIKYSKKGSDAFKDTSNKSNLV